MVLGKRRPPLLMPWRPFAAIEEIERLMEEAFAPFHPMWRRLPAGDMVWAPAIEMYEKEGSFIVRAELPGMKKEEIEISMTGDSLTIRGDRKASQEVKSEEYHRCELHYGVFSRSIRMPTAVDTAKIEAILADGVLEVRLPKVKEAVSAKIQVKVKPKFLVQQLQKSCICSHE